MIRSYKHYFKIYLLSLIIISITVSDQTQPTAQQPQPNAEAIQVTPKIVQPTPKPPTQQQTPTPSSQAQPQPLPTPSHSSVPNPQSSQSQPQQQSTSNSQQQKSQQQQQQQLKKKQQQLSMKHAQDSKISRYQQTRNQQRNQLKEIHSSEDYTIAKKNVLFQVDIQTEQFIISPTSDSDVIVTMLIYTLYNNAYGIIKDIDTQLPIHVYIYQNNNKIVSYGEFFFQKALKFSVKQGSYYSIRFRNSGQPKLVSFTYPSMIQSTHIDNLYKKQRSQYHLHKINTLFFKVQQITHQSRRHSFWDKMNNQILISYLKKYVNYQFIQMFFVLILAAYQIHVIKKLFKNDCIL